MTEKISNFISSIIGKAILQKDLGETMERYAAHQANKGFPFGELVLLHYRMMNGTSIEEAISLAAAVELLVLSFDILDDIEDGDADGKPWMAAPGPALNSATAMIFLCINEARNIRSCFRDDATDILMEYSLKAISGQHSDLLNHGSSEKDYIEMALMKSGSLTSLACLAGAALAAGGSPERVRRYSGYIGLIGQLNNDIADLWNEGGKSDLLNRKLSLPILYLLNNKTEKTALIRSYYKGEISRDEFLDNKSQVLAVISDSGAVAYAKVIKRIYQNKARDEFGYLEAGQDCLAQLIKYIQ